MGNERIEKQRHRSFGIVVSLIATLVVFIQPLPAQAHDGHNSLPLASDAAAGPFVISAWAVEHSTEGTLDLYVIARGEAEPRAVEVISSEGQVLESLSLAPNGAWTGILPLASEAETVEIRLTGIDGQRGAVTVSLAAPVIWGMSLIVLLLLAHAFVTLAWLLLRWPRAWGRRDPRAGGKPLETAQSPT